jgi:hypothetical protein
VGYLHARNVLAADREYASCYCMQRGPKGLLVCTDFRTNVGDQVRQGQAARQHLNVCRTLSSDKTKPPHTPSYSGINAQAVCICGRPSRTQLTHAPAPPASDCWVTTGHSSSACTPGGTSSQRPQQNTCTKTHVGLAHSAPPGKPGRQQQVAAGSTTGGPLCLQVALSHMSNTETK